MAESTWLFAYGSLIWRPNLPFSRRVRGYVEGYERRFWQASPDHRGDAMNPGRVATLHALLGGRCWGVAYELNERDVDQVLSKLDQRESAGYQRIQLTFHAKDRALSGALPALVYVAGPDNENYAGEATLAEIASVVSRSSGPSGHNIEYVLRLAEALAELGAEDEHVFELANLLSDPDDTEAP